MGQLQHPDEAAKEILDFIQALSAHGVCYALAAKKTMQCNCLASLSSRLEEWSSLTDQVVSEFIAFTCQTKEQQQKVLIKDVQMLHFIARGHDQVGKLRCFLLPGSFNHLICIGTYLRLIWYGREAMFMVKKHAESNTTPSHGLKGQHSEHANKSHIDVTIAMTTHFERLMEKPTPRATRLVKVMGGLDMHDNDNKQCELPTSMSK